MLSQKWDETTKPENLCSDSNTTETEKQKEAIEIDLRRGLSISSEDTFPWGNVSPPKFKHQQDGLIYTHCEMINAIG